MTTAGKRLLEGMPWMLALPAMAGFPGGTRVDVRRGIAGDGNAHSATVVTDASAAR